jgi:hypothetical protein
VLARFRPKQMDGHLEDSGKEDLIMNEAPAIIGTCINCIAPRSLGATLVLVLIGVAVALTAERLKERTDNSMALQRKRAR